MSRVLGNNPLFGETPEKTKTIAVKVETPEPAAPQRFVLTPAETPEEPVLTDREVQQIREYQSGTNDFVTMSFKVRKTHLKKLRDYAYTNRLEIKEALDEALDAYLSKIDDSELVEYREKPSKRKKV